MTKIAAILNITPDSFSENGENFHIDNAINAVDLMIKSGVDVIDIGAESTRPGAKILSYEEEWSRLKPVLSTIITMIKDCDIQISIDSYHYQTIEKCLDIGVDIVNDVSGGIDQKIVDLVADHGKVKFIFMHNLGVPSNPEVTIKEDDHISIIKQWAEDKIIHLKECGIAQNQIIFDPGIGFGKTAKQSLDIIRNINEFSHLAEIMVGHSRKSFMSLFSSVPASQRDIETYVTSIYLARNKVDYLRVHDYAGNRRAINADKLLWE